MKKNNNIKYIFLFILIVVINIFILFRLYQIQKIYFIKMKGGFCYSAVSSLEKSELNEINKRNINVLNKNNKIYMPQINIDNVFLKKSIFREIEKNDKIKNWNLEIPNILEKTKIKEGTDLKILDEYIGHFYNTSFIEGNVCLAAHNRGFKNNYFQNLHKIRKGEKLYYNVGLKKHEYEVKKIYKTNEYDLTCLYNTPKRSITLITCVKDEPQNRLVVVGEYVHSKQLEG